MGEVRCNCSIYIVAHTAGKPAISRADATMPC